MDKPFIYLDVHENKIKVLGQAMKYREVAALFNLDRTENKRKFSEAIKYIYHAYAVDHPLDNYSPQQRIKKVCTDYFEDREPEFFENNKLISAVIVRYIDECLTASQRFYRDIKKDMDDLLDHISKIPFTKRVKLKQKVEINVSQNGKEDMKEVMVDMFVDMDNSKEKFDAIARADKLLELEEKIRMKVLKDSHKKKEKSTQRIFDTRDEVH